MAGSNAQRRAEAEARIAAAVERLRAEHRPVTAAAVLGIAGGSKATVVRTLRAMRQPSAIGAAEPQEPVQAKPAPAKAARAVRPAGTDARGGEVVPLRPGMDAPAMPPQAKIGRPTKLTPELQERVTEALRKGLYPETAAALVGLPRERLYAWLKQGAQDPESVYGAFRDAFEKAIAESERDGLALIRAAGDAGAWQATAWRMERRWPDRWARRDALAVQLQGDVRIVVEHVADWHSRDVIEVEAQPQEPRGKRREKAQA